ncbi:MAG: D-alanine--D-alanine ligase family protein [bacterium]|nr:D-alanine--D-alanine ligase family protein [bacterium]
MPKVRVGLVFGGKSGEHEVSVRSAASIYRALDKQKYDVRLVGVDKAGQWHQVNQKWLPEGAQMKSLPSGDKTLVPQDEAVDVFFPIIHGTYGEDGSLQGLFELLNVAYVGAGVLGSAVGMDKDVMKRLLAQAGIPISRFVVLRDTDLSHVKKDIAVLGWPVFVKPVNMGSSVGISKVSNWKDLDSAVREAFQFDTKIIIEETIKGREIECSVLGNDQPQASLPGEVVAKGEFYDYQAKYIDENGAQLIVPAKLTRRQITQIQQLAIKAFQALECEGMARVDMFLQPNGRIVINEINTLPGFTSISMYPKLWEVSGLKYSKLLDKLISLALARQKKKDRLKRSYA